jgi:CRISPR-associated protein Csm1
MNYYLSYFLQGLRKYCGHFPQEEDLPDSIQELPDVSLSVWETALQLNYGSIPREGDAVPLRSVFEFLNNGKVEAPTFAFHPLSLKSDLIFPSEVSGDFQKLVTGFKNEWVNLKKLLPENYTKDDTTNFTDTLVFLSKKYFSNAGFSDEYPYISLHEHLKTTTALADCISREGSSGILLVGAGLDNIQGFCYDIVSSKAAKSLKGRSFYLQMLLDTLQQEIIGHPKINACLGHIIYARGGKMYLLLPDTKDCEAALREMSLAISEKFWQHFKASLHQFLGFEKINNAENDAAKQAWVRLDAKVKFVKNRRWSNLFSLENFDQLFSPIAEGGTNLDASHAEPVDSRTGKKMCRVTGEIIENPGLENILEEDGETGQKIYVSEFVKFQATLAEGIRDAEQYFWLKANSGQRVQKSFFTGSDDYVSLPDDSFSGRVWNSVRSNFQRTKKWSINEPENFLPDPPEALSYGFVFYGGNNQATVFDKEKTPSERIKFFHELAGLESNDEKGKGFHRLGVCRMDADRLGEMAKEAAKSFALNATFSARLDLFLSGYINEIRKKRDDYCEFLNILFAGGDDLLIVGRWDLVIEFAREIQQGFKKFIGGKDFLTLSGGMAMVTPKFPIAKAVELAGYAEDNAKKRGNAFALLGEVVSWDKEFEFVESFSKKLEAWLADEDSGISASFIFKIYQFNRMKSEGEPHWRWLSAWYFQQAEKANQRSQEIFKSLKKFVLCGRWDFQNESEMIFEPDRALPLLTLVGKIVDLKTRKNSKSDKT